MRNLFLHGSPVFPALLLFAAVSGICFSLPAASLAEDGANSLEQQVQELKSGVEILQLELGSLKTAPARQPPGVRVGGHLKFYTFDKSRGTSNGTDQRNNSSAGLSSFYLYVDKDISEKVSVSVYPKISVRAGATPSLGNNISRTPSPAATEISQAFIKTVLPENFELRAGMFYPVFSEEYANHIWWDEQYNANKGVCDLQSWTDSGIEVFKNFDFPGWTLAAHGYLLNGEGALADNNEGKSVLLHLAPEISGLKFMGAIGAGKWDNSDRHDFLRYTYGSQWQYGKLTLRGEYLSSRYNGKPVGAGQADTVKKGGYLKGLYRFNANWRALAVASRAALPYTAGPVLLKDLYMAYTLGLNFFLTDSSVIIGEATFVDARRSDKSQELKHTRLTIGVRSTF